MMAKKLFAGFGSTRREASSNQPGSKKQGSEHEVEKSGGIFLEFSLCVSQKCASF